MDIITRAEAGLPAPPSTLTRHSGSWPGITWHHTGGSYTTWKAIHDWQTDGRPEASELPYIGYSYGIARGRVTELRGWGYRPAGDHDNDRLQVCFMGTWDSKLPPAEDLAAAEEFLAWATAKNGKPLPGVSHRDVWPAGHPYDTDCPGDALHAWLKTMGDDMFDATDRDKLNQLYRAFFLGGDELSCGPAVPDQDRMPGKFANGLVRSAGNSVPEQLRSIRRLALDDVDEAALAVALAPLIKAGASPEQVAAAVRAELNKTRLVGG